MNTRTFKKLAEVKNTDDLFALLDKQKESGLVIAGQLGIVPALYYSLKKGKKISLLNIERIAAALSLKTKISKDIILDNFGFLKKDAKKRKRYSKKALVSKADELPSIPHDRPGYYQREHQAGCGGISFTISARMVFYSEEQQTADMERIVKARLNPESGLKDAMVMFWWLDQVESKTVEDFNFTKKEALELEATYRLCRIRQSNNLYELSSGFEDFERNSCPKVVEDYGIKLYTFGEGWNHEEDREKVTFDEKLSAIGMSKEDFAKLFYIRLNEIIIQDIEYIRKNSETESCGPIMEKVKQNLKIVGSSLEDLGIRNSEILSLVEKSMRLEATRQGKQFIEDGSQYTLESVVDIMRSYNLNWEFLGLCPKAGIKILLLGVIKNYQRRHSNLFLSSQAMNAVEEILDCIASS